MTIFGDLAREDNRYISSRTLNRLTAQIGVKPEATRVALHRLRKEDWLESAKFGRESHYRLTDNGRNLSREAAPRIYGAASGQALMLALYDPSQIAPEGLRIASGMSLVTSKYEGAMNLAVTDPLPTWMVDRLVACDVLRAARNLHARLMDFPPDRVCRNWITLFYGFHWCMNGAASFCVCRMFLMFCSKTRCHLVS